jgi:hypothetical protein
MDEDRPLPVELPAPALKHAQRRLSWPQAVNVRFPSMGNTGRANREGRISTHRRHSFGTDRFSRRKRQLLTAIAGQQAWRLRTPYFDFAVAGLTVGVTAPS